MNKSIINALKTELNCIIFKVYTIYKTNDMKIYNILIND